MRVQLQFAVLILWLLVIGCAEVEIIILSTENFGAILTLCAFVAATLFGLLIQFARRSRLKAMFDERTAIQAVIAARYPHVDHRWKAPEYRAVERLDFELFEYRVTTLLFVVPGILFHLLAVLLVVPFTRSFGWFLLVGAGIQPSKFAERPVRTGLPRPPRRLRR